MKKNNRLRLMAGCLLTGLTLFQPACSIRKQREKTTWRQEETYLRHTDSLLSTNKRRIDNEYARQWEMVRLSPPDSTGRQHISAIVRSRDIYHSRSFSEDSLQQNITQIVRQNEENRSDDKTEKQQTPIAVWKWAVGFIIVIGGIAGVRRINPNTRQYLPRSVRRQ